MNIVVLIRRNKKSVVGFESALNVGVLIAIIKLPKQIGAYNEECAVNVG